MIFTAPLGLLALLAVPAIVGIHLFRRRFPRRPVAGLFLWQSVQRMPETGGRVARLPITASLILECLAALMLALLLAGAKVIPAAPSLADAKTSSLQTEQRNPRTMDLDKQSSLYRLRHFLFLLYPLLYSHSCLHYNPSHL